MGHYSRAAQPGGGIGEAKRSSFARRTAEGGCPHIFVALDMFEWVCQAGGMKKQGSDQAFHDRRYQERKRAEAARKAPAKKKVPKQSGESRVASS
jgi:hypothetical protein